MLKQQQVADLLDHGYQVFRMNRSTPVFRNEHDEIVFCNRERHKRVFEHYRPWLYEIDVAVPDRLFIVGPDVNLMHRFTCLVKFEPPGREPFNVLVGCLDPTPETATEKAIDYLLHLGHDTHAAYPVLVI